MQIQVFSIPMEGDEEATQQLNLFLRTHKVLSIEKAPVIAAGRQYWSVCVEFLPRRIGFQSASAVSNNTGAEKQKIDYRQVLNPAEFARFSKLRQLRKQLAEREDMPVYTVFTNAQLAELARKVPKSKASLAEIDGLGDARLERYADALLDLLGKFATVQAMPVTDSPLAPGMESLPAAVGENCSLPQAELVSSGVS
jgi:superfamily II DNA helicase RecQ